MKQTAVEWLHYVSKQRELDKFDWEQAKEMEKNEKLKNQLFIGKVSEIIRWSKVIELMKECNETFKQQKDTDVPL
jgi:hypothetical protein